MDFDPKRFDEYREGNRLEAKAANGGLPGSLWDTIHNEKKVSLCLISERDVEEYVVGEDVVLVIKVPRATRYQRPVFINNDVFGSTFRRDHEGDYHCTKPEIKAMIRDASEESPDERVLDRKPDFDRETIKSYRIRYNVRHEGSAWSKLNDNDFLIKIGALNDEGEALRPTAAGLLMFGEELRITREYPEYFLDYREHMEPNIRWTDRIYSQEPEWSGNVYDFFNRVSAKLVLDLKKPFKLVNQVRVDETPMHDAVREALVNCLVNTDFYQPWNVIIEKYPDKITLANPGTIIAGKDQMLKGGISQPRNKGLFKMFNLIGYGEHAGSGVPDIFQAWKDAGLDAPIVEEMFGGGNPDRTVLTLPLSFTTSSTTSGEVSGGVSDEVHGTFERVIEFCDIPRTKKEIQEYLQIKSERYIREKVITPLIENGRIQRTIPDKPNSPKQKYIRNNI